MRRAAGDLEPGEFLSFEYTTPMAALETLLNPLLWGSTATQVAGFQGTAVPVLAQLSDHLRPVVQFLALTGWRVSEATSLRWSQVDFAGGVVRLEVGKHEERPGPTVSIRGAPRARRSDPRPAGEDVGTGAGDGHPVPLGLPQAR